MNLRGWEVRKRRPLEIEAHAWMLRGLWDLKRTKSGDDGPLAVMDVLEILMVGHMGYHLEIVEDQYMIGFEGATWPLERSILLPQSVYDGACAGDASSRFTVAHEIGHLVLHMEPPKFNRKMRLASPDIWSDSEHQADYFAGALLIPRTAIQAARSIQGVMDSCGVSYTAAKERIEQTKNSAW